MNIFKKRIGSRCSGEIDRECENYRNKTKLTAHRRHCPQCGSSVEEIFGQNNAGILVFGGLLVVVVGVGYLVFRPYIEISETIAKGITSTDLQIVTTEDVSARSEIHTEPDLDEPQPDTVIPPEPQSADAVLHDLVSRAAGAASWQRSELDKAFKDAEVKYPTDYRFTYDRVKLAILDVDVISHHEAFALLSRAAEKAIRSGKAQTMLKQLEEDHDGAFLKLAKGHDEWHHIQEALESADLSAFQKISHH